MRTSYLLALSLLLFVGCAPEKVTEGETEVDPATFPEPECEAESSWHWDDLIEVCVEDEAEDS